MMTQAHHDVPELPLTRRCRLVGVSRSGYDAHRTDATAEPSDVAVRDAIEHLVLDFPGYGYRRVTKQLHRDGWCVNHKRVPRLMREELLLCQLRRRFVVTTDSAHGWCTYPNRLTGVVLDHRDQAWVADMTYIRLPTTFVSLAAILDAYSRRCTGWALSRTIDTALTVTALAMAVQQRQPAPGVIHHSDRGVHYANHADVAHLEQAGLQLSMSAAGNPYDHAKAERFFKTLKTEEVYLHEYQTFAEAEANLDHFIEDVYHHKRLHSSLGYVPPAEFEVAGGSLEAEPPSLEVVRSQGFTPEGRGQSPDSGRGETKREQRARHRGFVHPRSSAEHYTGNTHTFASVPPLPILGEGVRAYALSTGSYPNNFRARSRLQNWRRLLEMP